MTWLSSFKKAIALNNGCVLLTVIETKGSTPCSVGDKIVYSDQQLTFGSIGGGNLEFQALTLAQDLLGKDSNSSHLEKYPLGATLGQCCGGYVKVMFESFVNNSGKLKKKNSWLETVSDLIEKQEDFVNCFGALNYAHGWLDSGVRLDVFDVNDDKLFTIK